MLISRSALNLLSIGGITKVGLLAITFLAVVAVLVLHSNQHGRLATSMDLAHDRQQAVGAISQAESLRLNSTKLLERLDQAFSLVHNAPDATEGLDLFVSARNASIKDLDELLSDAAAAVTKLEEKQNYFADPHIQSLLPPEVLPELDDALRHQLKDLKALQAEIHTLQTQLLPDIHARLKHLHAACDLKEQINGSTAAREHWIDEAKRIASLAPIQSKQ